VKTSKKKKNQSKKAEKKAEKKDDYKFSDLKKLICEIEGSYLEKLVIDKQEKWNMGSVKPDSFYPVENPIPSDSRFREDLVWVERNNF